MSSNSRIIDLQTASDDEVEEMCCVECSKTIPTDDKFFTCHYDGAVMEYCSDCFKEDAICDNSECADCSAYRATHPVCGCCGDVLEHDMNIMVFRIQR